MPQLLGWLAPDRTGPSLAITSPAAGAVAGSIALTATATDPIGVAGVQFKIDGVNVGAEDAVSPYTVSYDTHLLANGAHTISAVARDSNGNLTTATRSVTVANVTPASSYLDFGSYQEYDPGEGGYTNGRWFVHDRAHHSGADWRWSNGNDKALPANPDSTHYQMRIASLYATDRTESDGTYPHVVGVWLNGSEVADIGNWYSAANIAWGQAVNGGEVVHLEKWVTDGGDGAYTAFFAEAGMRVYYDFVIKGEYLS